MVFEEVAAELREADDKTAIEQLVTVAARRVDNAAHAGVTVGRNGDQFYSVGVTDDIVLVADEIQYSLGSGPCVDAIISDTKYNAADLRTDERWPEFGRRCARETGIVSMLSIRLYVESDAGLIAALNFYSHSPNAFGEESEAIAQLIATHGALVVSKASAEAKAKNLLRALQTSREIGQAIGIIMANQKVTSEQAFDLLRISSQHSHRKLSAIADYVIETGALPDGNGDGAAASNGNANGG